MLLDTEIRQAALLMLRRHGTSAAVRAGFRAGVLMEAGNPGASEIWVRIIHAINRIRAEAREAYSALPVESLSDQLPETDSQVA
ncbi:MAG TPA: hypothetical protein VN795_01680 [Stellaceae bacterium]|jgi:hypothetical protein|nr:hypothetical protein [Stellaceae bacterium]